MYDKCNISKGEFRSVCQAVGGINAMINEECKDKDALALVKYISEEQKETRDFSASRKKLHHSVKYQLAKSRFA